MQYSLLNRFKYLLSFIIVISMVSFISCSSDDEESNNGVNDPNPDDTPTLKHIDIASFAFSPQNITVNVGDTLVWKNMDNTDHRIVWSSGGFPTSANLGVLDTYQIIPMAAGTFSYICGIHPSMTGSITVN